MFSFAGSESTFIGNGSVVTSYGSGSVSRVGTFTSTAPACVGTFFSDTFTEEGTGNINLDQHTPDTGGLWTGSDTGDGKLVLDRGTDEIKSTNTGGLTNKAFPNLTADCTNYSVSASVKTGTTGNSHRVGVYGRWLDTSGGNGYRGRIEGDGTVRLEVITNGTALDLDTDTVASFSASTYYDLELRMSGALIRVYVNGVLECSATDTAHSEAGTIGMYLRNANVRMTSFSAAYL